MSEKNSSLKILFERILNISSYEIEILNAIKNEKTQTVYLILVFLMKILERISYSVIVLRLLELIV